MILSSKLLEYGFTLNTRNDKFSIEDRDVDEILRKLCRVLAFYLKKVDNYTKRAADLLTTLFILLHHTHTNSSQDPGREAGSSNSITTPHGSHDPLNKTLNMRKARTIL